MALLSNRFAKVCLCIAMCGFFEPIQGHISYGALVLGGDLGIGPNKQQDRHSMMINIINERNNNDDMVTLSISSNGNSNFTLNDNLTIAWEGSSDYSPNANDWIAFYCGNNVTNVADNAYMDYVYVSDADSKDWSEGMGFFHAQLTTTARLPQCQFRMFANNGYSLLGLSSVMFIDGYGGPSQLHLALTNIQGEMLIHWTSLDPMIGMVKYGLVLQTNSSTPDDDDGEESVMISIETSPPHTYKASDMCEGPANDEEGFVEPGWLHEAVMINLKPNQFYWYQVGGNGADDDGTTTNDDDGDIVGGGWSEVFSFQAAPLVGPNQVPFSYIVYGDMGVSGGISATETASLSSIEVNKLGARMTHHIGDISYARGNSPTWEAWFPLVEPYAATAPYMVGIGNHEYDHMTDPDSNDPSGVSGNGFHPVWGNMGDDSDGECGVPMFQRYHMPGDNSQGNSLFWYSYDFGNIHTIMLSSEHNCSVGSPQYDWLVQDLKAVDRLNKTPWLIVELHRPMYNSEAYISDYTTGLGIAACYEDLLIEYKVDLVLAGHYHSYLRSSKIYHNMKNETNGIYHYTIGSAGASLDSAALYPNLDWVEFFDDDFGYGRITVYNASTLLWEYVRNQDSSDNNGYPVVADSAWISH